MATRKAPRRPPDGFVPITRGRWNILCELLDDEPSAAEVRFDGEAIGWRRGTMWYVQPEGYRAVTGAWPPGYWPG